MKTDEMRIRRVLARLKTEKVLTMEEISKELAVSVRNTRRRLKKWGVLTSYNQNGRYYAHPDVADFDEYGVWSFAGAHFSKYGNLRDAFVGLVENSSGGVAAAEAGRALRLNPRSFMSHFRSDPRLTRERLGGRFVYFSAKPEVGERQRRFRLSESEKTLITDSLAVVLLVEKIKRPTAGLPELLEGLRKSGVRIDVGTAESFLRRHGLLKKNCRSER